VAEAHDSGQSYQRGYEAAEDVQAVTQALAVVALRYYAHHDRCEQR
jgi:hypothetical protein